MVYHSGLYFLNTFLCDIFLFCNNIDLTSHSDDNTPSYIRKPPEEEISQLEKSSKSIFEWFENKGMKMNPNKCHLLLSKNEFFEQMSIKIGFLIQDLITIFPKFEKQPVINFMYSLEFPTTSIKIKGEYFSIHTFYLNLITIPSYG